MVAHMSAPHLADIFTDYNMAARKGSVFLESAKIIAFCNREAQPSPRNGGGFQGGGSFEGEL